MIQTVAKATFSKPLKGTAAKLHYVFQIYTHGQSLRTDQIENTDVILACIIEAIIMTNATQCDQSFLLVRISLFTKKEEAMRAMKLDI